MPPKPIRIVLVDDHDLFREVLKLALSYYPGLQIVGEAGDGVEGQEVAIAQDADVVLMDVGMPVTSGIDAAYELHLGHPNIKTIMLTQHIDELNVVRALGSGVRGYLPKTVKLDHLVDAIRVVAKGGVVIHPSLMRIVVTTLADGSHVNVQREKSTTLTPKDVIMMGHLGAGETNKEIAHSLKLAESTVKNRLSEIYSKINVRDRAQASIYAFRHGMVPILVEEM